MKHKDFQSIIIKMIITVIILNLSPQVKAQTRPDGSAPQFLFPDFSMGKVRLKNGNIQTMILNYNTISERMVYKKDGNLFDMLNNESIDTIFIYKFKYVPVGNVYYEVLLAAPVSLFIQYQGDLIPPGAVAGYGGTSQVSNTKKWSTVNLSMGYYNLELPKNYTVKVDQIFWIRKDSTLFSYINERQFLKIFPENATELKGFIKKTRIKFDQASDQVRLARHCNEPVR